MIALALCAFVLIAVAVVWRRTVGIGQARELAALQATRLQLEAQRARLQRDIREATSRGRLAPVAERQLDMHVPPDSQVVILVRPPGAR